MKHYDMSKARRIVMVSLYQYSKMSSMVLRKDENKKVGV